MPKKSHKPTLIHNSTVHQEGFIEGNGELSPMSGAEPEYKPERWNDDPHIRKTHNCYAYSLNKRTSAMGAKAQPGYFANYPSLGRKDYKCAHFLERLKHDNPSVKLSKFGKRCGKNSYKVFLALDTKEADTDYHFYRQDSNGFWSHKPGANYVVDTDAQGKKIKNPKEADRSYKYFQYTEPCFFFCMNPRMARSHSRQSRRYDLS